MTLAADLRRRAAALTDLLGVRLPVIGAPMAGVSTPQLVAAVSEAGGLGSLACGMMEPAQIEAAIREVRTLTAKPFAVNLFITPQPQPEMAAIERMLAVIAPLRADLGLSPVELPADFAPDFDAQFAAVEAARVPVVSYTFGGLREREAEALRAQGVILIGTANTVREVKVLREAGCHAVVAQGHEAGGHRAFFESPPEGAQVGLFALLPQAARVAGVPLVAAGAVMDGAGIAAALTLGASGVVLGTALLRAPESGAAPARNAAPRHADDAATRATRAISGRPARGIANRLMDTLEASGVPAPDYPIQNALTGGLRRAAAAAGRADGLALWAGQGVALASSAPAADTVRRLWNEFEALLQE
ncbi:MAG: NAD(P)H-dependent flavin oxidoreductase [Betaproteobacteria bacterium]